MVVLKGPSTILKSECMALAFWLILNVIFCTFLCHKSNVGVGALKVQTQNLHIYCIKSADASS